MVKVLTLVLLFIGLFVCTVPVLHAQTTEFTYQGSMKDGASPANGNYDFEFKLFDLAGGGAQQGSTIQRLNVAVSNGIFTVSLDFGAGTLPGADRFLDIGVRTAGGGAFTAVSPRQKVNAAPYSVKSLNATNADIATNATQLGGVAANQFVVTTDPRMADARPPTAGSANYIQNQIAAPQASSNFYISGTGLANILSASTQYNLGGFRLLGVGAGFSNSFYAGINAGLTNVGSFNSFFGYSAGENNTGSSNSFFGASAGVLNTTGSSNSFFGRDAGFSSEGDYNAFFGREAGGVNSANNNSFFGSFAGRSNTFGSGNAFYGYDAGGRNTLGFENSFFGNAAGDATTIGAANSFFGSNAGGANTTGNDNSFFGLNAGISNTSGSANAFFGRFAGNGNVSGLNNSFFGQSAGVTNFTGSNNTIIGDGANVASGALNFATAIGSNAVVTTSSQVQLGRNGFDTVRIGTLAAATATQLCINGLVIAACSSSARYKENIRPFALGLGLVKRLQPMHYNWIESKEADLGLIAEDVAEVDPLLVTRDRKGEIRGVKYDQLTVVLINAVKEQQAQIEKQQALIKQLEKRLEQLEKKELR